MPAIEPETVRRSNREAGLPSFVYHPDFAHLDAAQHFSHEILNDQNEYESRYMPDDVTRDHARRMHYAAFRLHQATSPREQNHWQNIYFRLRDRIVLGNRKLIYRAVRRRMAMSNRADDLIGDCHIVLIQAVAAYNPWLGIRFSTYAYTCLVRALARLSQRLSSDWLARSVPLESLSDGEPGNESENESISSQTSRLDEFFREDHPLLSQREKMILLRRFRLNETADMQTLEKVGKELGLSKERVRQVQASALSKLRLALSEETKPA
ncbi:sigma-70 family RNA polymerase sigma factor [Tuwongella immobilis]|uniref:RNA polymerase sigma-70 domain-containing protein n=1 Tax=Tuwongella immobilis TaxID=692036 RepID=A0A6C2YKM2_9BACT|nr:sigma-70 family RNA polymerase sigma factor [Tuwongella immobilis]VIP01927.1 sigma-70 factor : RNA polymerase, sigma 32 subunit, RpoH OS=Isosphaera pallida (strain ATCC 43644 / DSM 9630 / IS1B) GN=Isop_0433 PE=4 SV=1: Sigma70_r2: Sigma70_r4 [Tuwongella immobilis]VTR99869.1 sigma-70 factor : RNA polymerase, sigma 32 subunit, RpoH OS=Isosphaera pallida (strain ATCC 43644 / DSM 9630 / IS1B) GN=Isop_0433 PE=4 SV=1: Sigma70_r2: Sigma70_r4 [Tuwongella immobilis]